MSEVKFGLEKKISDLHDGGHVRTHVTLAPSWRKRGLLMSSHDNKLIGCCSGFQNPRTPPPNVATALDAGVGAECIIHFNSVFDRSLDSSRRNIRDIIHIVNRIRKPDNDDSPQKQ
jgi:hypothetical protein